MTTAKAWRQKGTGRARAGALSVPHRYGGGAAFGPKPRRYTVKVNRKARRKALRAALSVHAERGTVAVLDGSGFARARHQAGGRSAARSGAPTAPRWSWSAPRRRRSRRASATSSASAVALADRRRGRRRDRRRLPGRLARRRWTSSRGGRADGCPPGDHPPGRLREELRPDGRGQVHLPGPRPGPQAPDRAGGRGDLRRQGARGAHRQGEAPSRSAAALHGGRSRSWKKAIVQLAPGERIELFEGAAVEG